MTSNSWSRNGLLTSVLGPDSDGKIKCTNGGNITVFFALKKEDDDEGDEGLALQSEEA